MTEMGFGNSFLFSSVAFDCFCPSSRARDLVQRTSTFMGQILRQQFLFCCSGVIFFLVGPNGPLKSRNFPTVGMPIDDEVVNSLANGPLRVLQICNYLIHLRKNEFG